MSRNTRGFMRLETDVEYMARLRLRLGSKWLPGKDSLDDVGLDLGMQRRFVDQDGEPVRLGVGG